MDADRLAKLKEDPAFREFSREILGVIGVELKTSFDHDAEPSGDYSYSQAREDHRPYEEGEKVAVDRLN